MDRRTFLLTSAAGLGSVTLTGSLWQTLGSPPETAGSAYGPLLSPDENGLRLPPGFRSRVVARAGRNVGPTSYRWHPAPDGGACFPDGAGWIYVSNSEVDGTGGASAIRFAADGSITSATRILEGTDRNCSGGPTPWGTWLSCEEVPRGRVFETDPRGRRRPVELPGMGRFTHEAAAVDPVREVVYLTEDEPDGCFYRFQPAAWPDLTAGRLEVLCLRDSDGSVTWRPVPAPSAVRRPTRHQVPGAQRFDGGEGAWYVAGGCWFTTKGDRRVWRYDADRSRLTVAADPTTAQMPRVDNLTADSRGELFVAEDGPAMRICTLSPTGRVRPFLSIEGHPDSEVTGPAFTPDGTRLYFSSQRGSTGEDDDGTTYEVTGPFHGARRGSG
ncbi:DUF839 domain-containing protein [Geodermatophilus sp. DF01-2]|uniref:alkaline phosphatase PhoX n=1 Tax=Geodermatophilus sp. DF01-2 TaxID=2559610 RepID=UPI001072FF45|nr:alkaline phosphatase PhoX [Geodermatophilus sp. DF01_2]TFV53671.1 DUF839 domain-containing protein [Geodermatophilus sp. DF01_2]